MKNRFGRSTASVIPPQPFPFSLPRGWEYACTDADFKHPDRRLIEVGRYKGQVLVDVIVPLTDTD